MIGIQLLMVGELVIVAGETAVLLVGGAAYIGVMIYNGVWETVSRFKSTPFTDALMAVIQQYYIYTKTAILFWMAEKLHQGLAVAPATWYNIVNYSERHSY